MSTLILSVFLLLHGPAALPSPAQAACPPVSAAAEERVRNLLSHPRQEEMRARFDLGTATSADVRALTNPDDLRTCNLLWATVAGQERRRNPGDHVSFFRSGNMYFVATRLQPPTDHLRLGEYSDIEVYDREYRFVLRFSA